MTLTFIMSKTKQTEIAYKQLEENPIPCQINPDRRWKVTVTILKTSQNQTRYKRKGGYKRLYDENTMELISGHYETGEYVPKKILQQKYDTIKHMTGYDLCRELYLSSLDLELYSSKDFWLDVSRKLWDQHLAFPLDPRDSHPCSFTAIMCEEWSAAYYCHLWSRVMAADMYSAFLEAGLNNRDELSTIGRRFRSTFLALGGGCHPGEVFRRFRGRDPSPKALLNALGLKEAKVLDVQSAKM